jgi:hypothetical protein
MGRTKGALNKQLGEAAVFSLTVPERIEIIAAILLDIIQEELWKAD